MNLPHDHQQPESSNPKPAAKKPYEKPAFRFERVFETQALNCGKTASQGQCHSSSRNS
jgi:hypothetical protein